MKRNRKEKIISLIALVVAILGITIGFAAFSNVLTISSTATVTPNSEEFKVNVYGIVDAESLWDIAYNSAEIDESYLSATSGACVTNYIDDRYEINNNVVCQSASIDNSTGAIDNIVVNFEAPNQMAGYGFIIKNEGQYDAYLPFPEELNQDGSYNAILPIGGICTAEQETSEELVSGTCDYISLTGSLVDIASREIISTTEPYYMLPAGESVGFRLAIVYDPTAVVVADGPFSVEFPTIRLQFTTTKPEQNQ